jgi:transcriptional regulator with XRE-family HTH domain
MYEQEESLCELWDEAQTGIHSHSRLHNLAPVGVGSPRVESLCSYITRLAAAHSVYPRVLITDEIAPQLKYFSLYKKGHLIYDNLTSFWQKSVQLNGVSSSARDMVEVLEQLTLRSDLRFLTLLTWQNVLPPRNLLRRTRAWCPACYEQWRESHQTIYEPLLWALEVIDVCVFHRLQLQLRCPYADCDRTQPSLSPHAQSGYCLHCNRWLGSASGDQAERHVKSEDEEWRRQQWVVNAMGDLLSAAPSISSPPPRKWVITALKKYADENLEGKQSDLARQLQISKSRLSRWIHGGYTPELRNLLQICSHLRVSPLYLLTGKTLETSITWPQLSDEKLYVERPKARHQRFDTESIRQTLETILQNSEGTPLSMEEVAQRLGYNGTAMLRRHLPELCSAISAQYRDYQKVKSVERLQRLRGEVRKIVLEIHDQGHYPSNRRVRESLSCPRVLQEPEVRAAWYETLRELGWNQ